MNNLYVPTTGNQIQFINILKIYDILIVSQTKLSDLGTAFSAVQLNPRYTMIIS